MIDVDVLIALLAAITLLAGLAARSGTPYPVVLVLGGLVMGLVPGIPSTELDPELVLVLFLPPLLFSAAFLSSTQELRANSGPILALAVGLVLLTTATVAAVAVLVAGLSWPVAFVLGAVLGPTDPVAATAILRRVGAPDRIVTILEGESLVNDATAITAYTIAIGAVATGHFSAVDAVGTFALEVALGTAIGLVAAWAAFRLARWISDPGAQLSLTLLTPFIAYIPADRAGGSGVLAAVAAGLYAGARAPRSTPATRLQLRTFWELLVFLLNAVLFLLIGMELQDVLDGIGGGLSPSLLLHALAIGGTVIALRLAWMFLLPPVAAALRRGRDATRASPAAKLVLGWSGMRGAVSLAIALAIPLQTSAGEPFPDRPLVIFLAYAAVLLTLVPPGFTLGPLIGRLGLRRGAERLRLLAQARARVLHSALQELEALATAGRIDDPTAERLRDLYQARLERVTPRLEGDSAPAAGTGRNAQVRRALTAAQRRELAELRAEQAFPADVLREIEQDLDLEELRQR